MRLYAILARQSSKAVVFRRGPSRWVRMIAWDRNGDIFDRGQWFKGRIYERRCDLSPSGALLVYFAANWKPPYASWTAVSRPPLFTALALWPNGTAWGGGGHFDSETHLALNQGGSPTGAQGSTPQQLCVAPLAKPPTGEDDPIHDLRLRRDGWSLVAPSKGRETPWGSDLVVDFDPPLTYEKLAPRIGWALERRLRGIGQRNGPWYVLDHRVRTAKDTTIELADTDWADWDTCGDLLFARDGCLYRLRAGCSDQRRAVRLIDFNDDVPEERPGPLGAPRANVKP